MTKGGCLLKKMHDFTSSENNKKWGLYLDLLLNVIKTGFYLFVIGLTCVTCSSIRHKTIFHGERPVCERVLYVFLGHNGMDELRKACQEYNLNDINNRDKFAGPEDISVNKKDLELVEKDNEAQTRYSYGRDKTIDGWLYAGAIQKDSREWLTCNININAGCNILIGGSYLTNKSLNIRESSPQLVSGSWRKGKIIDIVGKNVLVDIIGIDTISGTSNRHLIWLRVKINTNAATRAKELQNLGFHALFNMDRTAAIIYFTMSNNVIEQYQVAWEMKNELEKFIDTSSNEEWNHFINYIRNKYKNYIPQDLL